MGLHIHSFLLFYFPINQFECVIFTLLQLKMATEFLFNTQESMRQLNMSTGERATSLTCGEQWSRALLGVSS